MRAAPIAMSRGGSYPAVDAARAAASRSRAKPELKYPLERFSYLEVGLPSPPVSITGDEKQKLHLLEQQHVESGLQGRTKLSELPGPRSLVDLLTKVHKPVYRSNLGDSSGGSLAANPDAPTAHAGLALAPVPVGFSGPSALATDVYVSSVSSGTGQTGVAMGGVVGQAQRRVGRPRGKKSMKEWPASDVVVSQVISSLRHTV